MKNNNIQENIMCVKMSNIQENYLKKKRKNTDQTNKLQSHFLPVTPPCVATYGSHLMNQKI